MHSSHQHFLVIGTVEYANSSALGKAARSAPEKIVLQFLGAWLLEAEDFAPFRINTGHDVPDGAVFAGTVHTLENQQQRVPVGSVVKLLQRAQLLHMLAQKFLVLLFRLRIR